MNWSCRLLRLSLVLVVGLVFGGWTAPWSSVMHDADGYVTGVTAFVHLPSGGTLYEVDATGNVTVFQVPSGAKVWWGTSGTSNDVLMQAADGGVTKVGGASARNALGLAIGSDVQAYDAATAKLDTAQVWSATQTLDEFVASRARSGASPANTVPDAGSGASIEPEYHNTIITHNQATSTVYGLPAISGVSVTYFKFIEGAAGSGITLYTADTGNHPFMGYGLSGTSYVALPPGNQYESVTVYSTTISGTCAYWFVEASASWVAGD